MYVFCSSHATHRYLHVPTHSVPTRRSSDLTRPCHAQPVTRSAQMGFELLEQGGGRIHRPGTACWIYLIGIWSSHLVDIVQLFFERLIRVPCKLDQFIKGAFGPTLATGAIVAFDKHDQCIG